MPVKPGYKQTEVGVIPVEWNPEFIENLVHITTGGRNTQIRLPRIEEQTAIATVLSDMDEDIAAVKAKLGQSPAVETGHDAGTAHRAHPTGMKHHPGNAGFQPARNPPHPGGQDARAPGAPRGWYSRGYLPHYDGSGLTQFITFRLADSVPRTVITGWKAELDWEEGLDTTSPQAIALRRRIAEYEDAGHGACHLRDPRIAELVQNALFHFDGTRYRLLAWCLMPNHVHVLIRMGAGNAPGNAGILPARTPPHSGGQDTRDPGGDADMPHHPLSSILHSWKSFTASQATKILRLAPGSGPFWMPDTFDRFIRDEAHHNATVRYLHENPVKAGLCLRCEDWQWSSARYVPGYAGLRPARNPPHSGGQDARAPGVPRPD